MKRLLVLLVFACFGTSCKGKTEVRDNPETAQKLEACEENLKEKIEFINDQNARLAEAENGGGEEGTIVVTIEGEIMKIKAGRGKGPNRSAGDSKGDAKDEELYAAFLTSLKRSRGAIKKCYQNALKKNTALSARSVKLDISVDYRTNGKVRAARYNPRISPQFNSCMDGVSKKWTLPAMPRSVTFNYKQTLTPE